ncbi:hypothetical protein EAY64_06005 [Aquitalea palustris]|uniref:Uncharacterized protein n=1 Tax=Aquitalea palustris TaxID=2480983 RepID=A0A454JKM9_9NEIS|nr:hypothetical protein EAY64_06005 [Aquitalea palustris]
MDIKNGTCKKWIQSKGGAVLKFFVKMPVVSECNCSGGCDGYVSPPVVEDILDWVKDFLSLKRADLTLKMVDSNIDQEWMEVGEVVYSFGYANKQRVI